jgi:hypothetical protein
MQELTSLAESYRKIALDRYRILLSLTQAPMATFFMVQRRRALRLTRASL